MCGSCCSAIQTAPSRAAPDRTHAATATRPRGRSTHDHPASSNAERAATRISSLPHDQQRTQLRAYFSVLLTNLTPGETATVVAGALVSGVEPRP